MCIRDRSSVIQIIHCNVGLKCFHLPKFLLLLLVLAYIYISQGSVETHLWCGGIYNNQINANCPQSVPVKEFWKNVNNWWRYGQKVKCHVFFTGPRCIMAFSIILQTAQMLSTREWTKSMGLGVDIFVQSFCQHQPHEPQILTIRNHTEMGTLYMTRAYCM